MKMRVQGNSIRFRLNRIEVAEFAAEGRVATGVAFGGGSALTYTLERSEVATGVEAAFLNGSVVVQVPSAKAKQWTSSEDVGIHGSQAVGGGVLLEITIEKDFQCMHRGEEAKDPEAYPNPMATA